jgi:hypothetical protein
LYREEDIPRQKQKEKTKGASHRAQYSLLHSEMHGELLDADGQVHV